MIEVVLRFEYYKVALQYLTVGVSVFMVFVTGMCTAYIYIARMSRTDRTTIITFSRGENSFERFTVPDLLPEPYRM